MKKFRFKPQSYKINLSTDEVMKRIRSITYIKGASDKADCEYKGSINENTFSIYSKNSSMLVRESHPYINGKVTQGENYSILEISQEPDKKGVFLIIAFWIWSVVSPLLYLLVNQELPIKVIIPSLFMIAGGFLIVSFFESIGMDNNIYTIEKLFEDEIIKDE